jgi:hypothetical protein
MGIISLDETMSYETQRPFKYEFRHISGNNKFT